LPSTLTAPAVAGRKDAVRRSSDRQNPFLEPLAAKVPEITVLFWVIKLITTFMGEVTSDYLGDVNILLGGVVEVGVLALAIWLQFRTRHYFAPAYWFLAVAIAIFGTGVSDTLHIAIGIPYAGTTAFWCVVLAAVFWRWHRSEGTLSIHSITTRRREAYYWATVFATFALGTALGDLTATSLNLGYLPSGLMFAGIFAIPAIAWWRFGLNPVVAFWAAYVVTRPLGASFADYVSKSHSISGINFGDGPTSGVSTLAIILVVAYISVARSDIQPATTVGSTPSGTGGPAGTAGPDRRPASARGPGSDQADLVGVDDSVDPVP
jgi:uncharacterized membrane-anchored protein